MKKKVIVGVGILFILILLLWITNYSPNSYLLGWDSVQNDLAPFLGIKRAFFAVWEEYQSVGLLAGMGHAADLVRTVFIFILSLILPQSIIRYTFQMIMVFVGAVGMYNLLRIIEFKKENNLLAFLGSVFYIFNLGAIQINFFPFESFSVFFAMLPWGMWSFFQVTDNKTVQRKNWIIFLLINFLATPFSLSQQLFVVYGLILILITFSYLFKKERIDNIRRSFVALILILMINSFWLLPQLYFTITSRGVFSEAKINQQVTEDIFYRNLEKGTLADFITMKGFFYDTRGMDNRFLFETWKIHADNSIVQLIILILAFLPILGLFYKSRYRLAFVLLYLLVAINLLIDTPPFSLVNEILRNNELFNIIFRSPFTKFIIPYSLVASYFFVTGVALISEKINQLLFFRDGQKNLLKVLSFFCFVLIFIRALPAFQGYYISPEMKVKVPKDYLEMMNYFSKVDKNKRIALLPDYTFWGWFYNKWGYNGSGFLWYGIEQPIVSRNFDYWSDKSENYYWEAKEAADTGDAYRLEKVLDKYNIDYLLVDYSLLPVSGSFKGLKYDQLNAILTTSGNFSLVNKWENIALYQVKNTTTLRNFIYLSDKLPVVGSEYKWNNYDKAYEEYGNYISDSSTIGGVMASQAQPATPEVSLPDIYYPFRSLFTGRKQDELEFGVEDNTNYFSFTSTIPKQLVNYQLSTPAIYSKEVTELDASDLDKQIVKPPEIYLDGEFIPVSPPSGESSSATLGVSLALPYIREGKLEVRVPKISGYYSYDLQPTTLNLQPKSCDQFNEGLFTHEQVSEGGNELLRLTSVGSSNCLDFDLPNLTQDIGYLVTIENKNIEGKSLLFSIINKNSQRADLETYLPKRLSSSSTSGESLRNTPEVSLSHFIIPPMEQYGVGYTLHLDNISIGREKTVNDLGKITVNPIPYRLLTGLKVIKDSTTSKGSTLQGGIKVDHPNPSLYRVVIDSSTSGESLRNTPEVSLVLSQSFDDGWHAYGMKFETRNSKLENILQQLFPFFFGREIKDHVLVNNWENGWQLQNSELNKPVTVIIVYLPQYLEYIGFILLGVAVIIVILYPKRTHS